MDCGPSCIRIIAKFYGKNFSRERIVNLSETTREGSTLLGLSDAAEAIGFRSLGARLDFLSLEEESPFPCIAHWNKSHFIVVYKIKDDIVYVSDPAYGLITYTKDDFIKGWVGNNTDEVTPEGIILILDPTPKFNQTSLEVDETKKGLKFLYKYIFRYKKFLTQLLLGLIAGSLLQLVFPFLTQSIVDIGIQNQDINFIYLILLAQLMLFLGKTSIELIRGWILLHLSTRINISLISDFFIKLMSLPIAFFDVKMTGDIMQRIQDHRRIEHLLTSTSLSVLFSFVTIVLFSFVLFYYSFSIFLVFLFGSLLYFLWVILFLKKRRKLDYKRFAYVSQEQSKIIELINGMQEIKLNNAEKQKRWGWEHLQARLFKVSIQSLTLEQSQTAGSMFINELKNIFISFLSATLVINGEMTLGMMLSVSYIIGELNAPITQIAGFAQSIQDAKISLERLQEIHVKKEEDDVQDTFVPIVDVNNDLILSNVSFRYTGTRTHVLDDLNILIPGNKVTAIVGASGSGKTTLMKLLLKFYEADIGEVRIGEQNLKNISQKKWRDLSGVVMQEGYIFNDTIARNIAVGQDVIDKEKLRRAVTLANIKEYIEGLPTSYNTKIGLEGVGLSAGQKQRILIARAIYKDPKLFFLDEATSALDANNEKIIMNNLEKFYKNKTVVVIAHRLSTVKNADKIIVLEKGKVIEEGNHQALVNLKGRYFSLVKNQLDLGKLND